MKTLKQILLGSAMVLGIVALASCSDDNKMIGSWENSTPVAVFPVIEGTVSATETSTFDFAAGADSKSGPVKLTTVYQMTLPADSTGVAPMSTVNATIDGTWTRDDDDDDDFFISFDKNSLSVNAVSAPSLGPVTAAFLAGLSKYSKIDDVEVNKEGSVLTFEDTADTKYVMSRVNK